MKVLEPLAKRGIASYRKTGGTNRMATMMLVAHPDEIWLEVGRRKMKVRGDCLTGTAREGALTRIANIAKQYGDYQKKTDREIPIVRLTRISG